MYGHRSIPVRRTSDRSSSSIRLISKIFARLGFKSFVNNEDNPNGRLACRVSTKAELHPAEAIRQRKSPSCKIMKQASFLHRGTSFQHRLITCRLWFGVHDRCTYRLAKRQAFAGGCCSDAGYPTWRISAAQRSRIGNTTSSFAAGRPAATRSTPRSR